MSRVSRLISALVAAALCCTATALPVTVGAALTRGDVDSNGSVSTSDVAKLASALHTKLTLSSAAALQADVDANNRADIVDLLMLKRYSASLISGFPSDSSDVPEDVIYASANGKSSGTGTSSNPYDVATAIAKVAPGGTIYCAAGTYNFDSTLLVAESVSGTANGVKTISSYNGDVIFDYSALSVSSSNRGVSMEASYWHWYGITIQYAGDNGMILAGDNNKIEMCVFRNNQDTGLQLSRVNTNYSSLADWPSNNLILNCTACNNCDDATMENADGFAAKLTCGNGNVFDGCMSYNNSDDGWDLYAKDATGPIGVVTIKNSIAFRNGYTEDGRGYGDCDGNGFKLGGAGVGTPHVVTNCIAFENLHHGFTDNNNPDLYGLSYCTSYANAVGGGKANFQCDRCDDGTFAYLLSYTGGNSCGSDKLNGTISNSVFYNSSKYYQVTSSTSIANSKVGTVISGPTDSDFFSLSIPAMNKVDFHEYWRNADGSVTTLGAMMPVSSSEFYDLGAKFAYSGDSSSHENEGGGGNEGGGSEGGGGNEGGGSTDSGSGYVQNFTSNGLTSSFFTINGNLSTSKGSVSYGGQTLTQCLKMESSTSISFTTANAYTLTLVLTDGTTVLVDGTAQTIPANGVLALSLAAGSHSIAKGSGSSNLFYMSLS